jgi:acyl carrier protein
MEIKEILYTQISELLAVKKKEIKPESNFTDDFGADSLDLVELVMALEEELGVELPDKEVELLSTVGETLDYLEKKIAKKEKKY